MILTFTDFGWSGPYLGEMRAAALRLLPGVPYVDLMADAPAFRPDLAAYLLPPLAARLRKGDVLVGVVDPGVGGARLPLAVKIDDLWLVGPDNGLFELMMRRARSVRCFAITWQPAALSSSFHGRDLFAPTAALIARGEARGLRPVEPTRFIDWPDDLDRVVHVDGYGNLITGRRARTVDHGTVVTVTKGDSDQRPWGGQVIRHARVFAEVPPGTLFWYENSNGLLEIAQSGGSAARSLDLAPGASLRLQAAAADGT